MAKLDANSDAFTRKDVIRVRGRVQVKNWKGKAYIAKWPRRRGPKKTALQAAWVGRFSCLAEALKAPHPKILDSAQTFTKGTGWYYRDALERAAAGCFIHYQGEECVKTPSVYLDRITQQTLFTGGKKPITPTRAVWDNNAFWSATVNPTRITFKAPGLYSVGGSLQFNTGTTDAPVVLIVLNGVTELVAIYAGANGSFQTLPVATIFYFHANDYIELQYAISNGSSKAICNSFWALGATPEVLLP